MSLLIQSVLSQFISVFLKKTINRLFTPYLLLVIDQPFNCDYEWACNN